MIKTIDGTPQTKRISTGVGERTPLLGGRKLRSIYTATGGETSINLSLLNPPLSYMPLNNQISVKRSSGGNPISGTDFFELTPSSIGFPISDPLIAGEIVEISLDFFATGVMACTPRPDVYTAYATAGQTLITSSFAWTYNLNSGSGIGGCILIIEGIVQTRGAANDYTEVSLGTSLTNQLLLTQALLGGEKIIILPTYQPIDTSAASTTFYGQAYSNLQDMLGAGIPAFIDETTLISVPNTAIINRAKIPDIANDLKASLGIERIPVQSIYQLQNEIGSNGEPVFGALNDTRGLIRLVGNWYKAISVYGQYFQTSGNTTDYIEVVIYGTGLNFLTVGSNAGNVAVSYDGGSETTVTTSGGSTIIYGRNYSGNSVINLVSGLTLGIHTVKIRTTNQVLGYGFEILNDNASGLVNINSGRGFYQGKKFTNNVYDSIAYDKNQAGSTVVTGTKGGRIVRYISANDTLETAWQAVNTSAAYLASADHTNEEIARTYHWREFGAGRSSNDDWSLVAIGSGASLRAFTLEDGTTTLHGAFGGIPSDESFYHDNGTSVTFTFIGTGLDLYLGNGGGGAKTDNITVYIDGTSVGSLPTTNNTNVFVKIASGLAYGTHTVTFSRTQNISGVVSYKQFIIYQPKKPTLPTGVIEIADYNVVASFVANPTASITGIATGVERKVCSREWVYVGAWGITFNTGTVTGWYVNGSTGGNYAEYTFWGTGFDLRFGTPGGATGTYTLTLDGSSNFSSYTTGAYGSGVSFVASTGVITATTTSIYGAGVYASGIALGKHTLRMTYNSGSAMPVEALDIITPIHSYKSTLYADLQNTLPVGSCSMMDLRVTQPLTAQKNLAQAAGIWDGATTSSTSFVPIPDLSCVIKTTGRPILVCYHLHVQFGAGGQVITSLFVDGTQPLGNNTNNMATLNVENSTANAMILNLPAGYHKIDVYWKSLPGTAVYSYINTNKGRQLSIIEL